jgi:Zn-dependent protease
LGRHCGEKAVGDKMDFLERWLAFPIQHLPFIFIVLMIAFTLHEFAHAYTAYKFGDNTAHDLGRVSLNPKVHLDVLGTLFIFIAGFGWAKPVPVIRSKFKYPRLMGIVVSAAGPFTNLLIAIVGMLIMYMIQASGVMAYFPYGVNSAIVVFFFYLVVLNFLLFIFNLIPLPPLDGYRVIEDLAPIGLRLRMMQYEQWGIFIFLILVFIPPLFEVTLGPILSLQNNLFYTFNYIFISIFGVAVNWWEYLQN